MVKFSPPKSATVAAPVTVTLLKAPPAPVREPDKVCVTPPLKATVLVFAVKVPLLVQLPPTVIVLLPAVRVPPALIRTFPATVTVLLFVESFVALEPAICNEPFIGTAAVNAQ